MKKDNILTISFLLIGYIVLSSTLIHAQNLIGLTQIELTLVDSNATGYATFQSHNQKIVSNDNGIFMTHIRSRNEEYTAQQWRFSRSTDGGKTFMTIYEATNATNPPVLETDEENNIYLIRPDFLDGRAYVYRFLAQNNYTNPIKTWIRDGSAGKYCMVYDPKRLFIYYFAWGRRLWGLTQNGSIRLKRELCKDGNHAAPQYPLCFLDNEGSLHTAWTTQKHGVYLYWDIHYMVSPDSGRNWQKMDGTSLTLPIKVDDSGPSDRITLDDEFDVHTWLSNFMVKDGKIHFLYMAQFVPYRQHYVRYDVKTGAREIDIQPDFKGKEIYLLGLDGFFSSTSSLENAPLYCIGNFGGYPACLASDDNGETWYDYATCEQTFNVYSLGGCREITGDGYIIGTFTDYKVTTEGVDKSQVHFLKIKAGLSKAEVSRARYSEGNLFIQFQNVRGQPEFIRFKMNDGTWSEWIQFFVEINTALATAPTYFQLKSRMGIESSIFIIDYMVSVFDKNIFVTELVQNDLNVSTYPNPFNSQTTIKYELTKSGLITISVYDLSGRLISHLLENEKKEIGVYAIPFDGSTLVSGVYLYQIHVRFWDGKHSTVINKIALLK